MFKQLFQRGSRWPPGPCRSAGTAAAALSRALRGARTRALAGGRDHGSACDPTYHGDTPVAGGGGHAPDSGHGSLLQECHLRYPTSTLAVSRVLTWAVAPLGGRISVISRVFDRRYGGSGEPADFCNRRRAARQGWH